MEDTEQPNHAKSSLFRIGERFFNSLLERFSAPETVKRNRVILLLGTASLLTFLLIPGQQISGTRYKAGDVAGSDIRATQDYLLEDRLLTEKKRNEAEALVPYVYDFNATASQELTRRFEKALGTVAGFRSSVRPGDRAHLGETLSEALGVKVSPQEISAFLKLHNDRAFLSEANRLIGAVYSNRIVSDLRLFNSDLSHGIIMQDCKTCEPLGTLDRSFKAIGTAEAQQLAEGMKLHLALDRDDVALLKGVISRSIQPNLVFNRQATDDRRSAARNEVSPVLFQLKRGEMIVRSGERLTQDHIRRLEQIYEGRSPLARLVTAFGIFCLVLILCYFPYRFALKNIRKFSPGNKDLVLISLVTLFHFTLLKIGLIVSTGMGGMLPTVGPSSFYFLFPFAFAPMLVRIILNSEVALVYCAACTPLAGIMFDGSLQMVIYALMGGVVGAHGVRQCKDRGVIYNAGLKVSVVNVALALSFQVSGDSFFSLQTLYCAGYAMIGGLVNATLVTGIIPAVESIFQYSTDMKLLEFSNLSSPLLHSLMVRAPGTYHHCVLVGNLVEAAAETIHANPLLAKVAAYYHDIGKISKPLYFIENVKNGENKHDKLSPSMSALILIAHVKEGAELAKENRLGQQIIDIIRQSHGTSLISYFFQKAKSHAVEPNEISDKDYRYPGPKPQTREAGLVMLADAVEAASRTLVDPTPARIQGLVQKIINNIFIDGQLDECELTLKNLHEIAKSFNRVLNGIYHHRIDYPQPAFKEKAGGGRKVLESGNIEPPAASPDGDAHGQKGSGESLRRLGSGR